jgi:Tol biopolymer transport system component
MGTHAAVLWEITDEGQNLHRVLPSSDSAPMQCCGMWTADQKYYVFDAWKDLESGPPTAPASNLWAVRESQNLFLHKPEVFQLTTGPVHFFTHVLSPDGKSIFALSTGRHGELMRYDSAGKRFSTYLSGISAEGVNFSRDGEWVAYIKFPQGELWRSKADGSQPLQLTFRPLRVFEPHWSPDGKRIAFAGQKIGTRWQPYTVSADGSTPARAELEEGGDPTWSPDGNSLLVAPPDFPRGSGLRVLNLQTKEISIVPGSKDLGSPRWSPDGRFISAVPLKGDSMMLFDFKTQKWTEQVKMDAGWQAWSRDGKYVYFANEGPAPGIFQVSVLGNKLVKIADLKNFQIADPYGSWFSLTPKDEPLVLRDTGGGTEVYALDWDAP